MKKIKHEDYYINYNVFNIEDIQIVYDDSIEEALTEEQRQERYSTADYECKFIEYSETETIIIKDFLTRIIKNVEHFENVYSINLNDAEKETLYLYIDYYIHNKERNELLKDCSKRENPHNKSKKQISESTLKSAKNLHKQLQQNIELKDNVINLLVELKSFINNQEEYMNYRKNKQSPLSVKKITNILNKYIGQNDIRDALDYLIN